MSTFSVLDDQLPSSGLAGGAGPHAFKIVVTGPVGAGKTTFINTISEVSTVSTEAAISGDADEAALAGPGLDGKDTTTVGIDFGQLSLPGGLELYLFGTPGQERFSFMWDIVSQGMLGVIVLVDCARPETHETARAMLDYFRGKGDVPAIIAANKVTDYAVDEARIVETLGLREGEFVIPTDALDRAAVKQTLIELLELVVASLV
jgi:small GTP-binding protein